MFSNVSPRPMKTGNFCLKTYGDLMLLFSASLAVGVFLSLDIATILALFQLLKYSVHIFTSELFCKEFIFMEFFCSCSIAYSSASWNVTSSALCYICYSMTLVLTLPIIPLINVQGHPFWLHCQLYKIAAVSLIQFSYSTEHGSWHTGSAKYVLFKWIKLKPLVNKRLINFYSCRSSLVLESTYYIEKNFQPYPDPV